MSHHKPFAARRGFAAMSPEKQRAISGKGGRAAHIKGTAHTFDALEARQAGRRGGESVSNDRNHMAEIGRRGGIIRAQNAAKKRAAPLAEGTYQAEVQSIDRTKRDQVEVEIRVMEIDPDAGKSIPVLRRHNT